MMLIGMIPMGILNFVLLIVSPFGKILRFLLGWLVGFIRTRGIVLCLSGSFLVAENLGWLP
jgi:hypothetical protein